MTLPCRLAQALRDWDLWGPLIFTIVLVRMNFLSAPWRVVKASLEFSPAGPSVLQAVLLSLQSDNPQSVFALVFAIVWFGAVALTLNVLLLVSDSCPCNQ